MCIVGEKKCACLLFFFIGSGAKDQCVCVYEFLHMCVNAVCFKRLTIKLNVPGAFRGTSLSCHGNKLNNQKERDKRDEKEK